MVGGSVLQAAFQPHVRVGILRQLPSGAPSAGLAARIRKDLGHDVLCPIALDDSWQTCDWGGPLRTQIEKYNILDFSTWQKPDQLEEMFRRLIKGLDLFYKRAKE